MFFLSIKLYFCGRLVCKYTLLCSHYVGIFFKRAQYFECALNSVRISSKSQNLANYFVVNVHNHTKHLEM